MTDTNINLIPIFKKVLGESWNKLPPVMLKHYANRPYSDDLVIVDGVLDVMSSGPVKLFASLFWLMGGVPPYNEKNVPVTVSFESNKNNSEFCFNRIFHFQTRKSYRFKSKMIHTSGDELIEVMRFGIGWKMQFLWEDECIKLKHKGYVFKLFGYYIPLPLTLLFGEGNAQEKAIDENSFSMSVDIKHPWWGNIYQYKGKFKVRENQ